MDTSSNPYALYPSDVGLSIKEGPCFVDRFVFVNYTDSEHRCRVVDRDGRDVFNVRGNLEYEITEIEVDYPGVFWDMRLLELGSGNLYIYIR